MKNKDWNQNSGNRILHFIAIISLIWCTWTTSIAQNDFCLFNDYMADMIDEHPNMIHYLETMEYELQQMMENDPQTIMNQEVYTIPVVFHVIHLGKPEGTDSNISDARIDSALKHLNDDFRDVLDTAVDVKIEFCLAQRDTAGNPTDGINRFDGSDVPNYESMGIGPGGNEYDVKELSVWPNDDYINIWIVHAINSSSGTLGYASFPNSDPAIDGIVLVYDHTGISTSSGVITHEVGHFFSLYHTFEGGDLTTCPPNSDCEKDGDKICDTDPHKQPTTGSCPTGNNPCTSNPIDEVSHNHLNYTGNSCRYAFTDSQSVRMRATLMTQREGLMNSLGCDTPCTNVIADFSVNDVEFNLGDNVSFTNSSINATSYSWKINEFEEGTTEDLNYTFNEGGVYKICLYAMDSICTNRKCTTIIIRPFCIAPQDTCNKVVDGDFEQISPGDKHDYMNVCGWKAVQGTPFFCDNPTNNIAAIYVSPWTTERITTEETINVEDGKDCMISFDYWLTGEQIPEFYQFALVSDNDVLSDLNYDYSLPPTARVIAQLNEPYPDDLSTFSVDCDIAFQPHHYMGYVSDFPSDKYLTIIGKAKEDFSGIAGNTIYIDNIEINCCDSTGCIPEPDFTYNIDTCGVSFNGTNTGDPGMYSWDFGDGTHATGQEVTHDYIYGGVFNVCLSIYCDVGPPVEICKDITISEECNTCEDEAIAVSSTICRAEGETNTYTANFSMQVPKDYKFCEESNPFIHTNPNKVTITVTSFDYDESNPNYDVIDFGIQITEIIGYDFGKNGATGKLILCGLNGEMMCYTLALSGSECDNCYDLSPVTMDCEDTDPFDGEFYYEGSLDISGLALPRDMHACSGNEITSADNGLELQNVTEYSIGNYTIDFSFTTKQAGVVNTSAIFCLYDQSQDESHCFNVSISVDPCDTVPTDCVKKWSVKQMECDTVIGDNVIINISKTMSMYGYQICSGGLSATIEGNGLFGEGDPSVVVNSWSVPSLNTFSYDLDIILPIDYYQNQTFDLRLYLCDGEGNLVCFLFPFEFSCDIESFDGGEAELRSSDMSLVSNAYSIFPNPANDRIFIDSYNWNEKERSKKIRLIDNLGNVIYKSQLTSKTMDIDISRFAPGLYYIIILDDEDSMFSKRVVIMN